MADLPPATTNTPPSRAATPIVRRRRKWGEALTALRKLLSNKEDTGQVFVIMRALTGNSGANNFARMVSTIEGARQCYERAELAHKLMDDAWLDTFAPGTVGAAYRHFVRSENLSAEGLAQVSREKFKQIDLEHPYEWLGRRIRDVHDIWHVLTGYHRDGLGEACLVAFSFAQTRNLGWALIATGAALRHRRASKLYPFTKAIWQGYLNGRKASWLVPLDYERLLHEPLESARKRLNLQAPSIYDSIPVAYRNVMAV